MTRGQYSQWEVGSREPNIASLYMLADFHNVSVDYLLGRTAKAEKFCISESRLFSPAHEDKNHPDITLNKISVEDLLQQIAKVVRENR